MKRAIIVSLITVITFSVNGQSKAEDHQEVAKTLNYYLVGGTNNDFETLKKAFHETATMKFIRDGAFQEVNALEFFGKGMKPGPPSDRQTRIAFINIAGDAASAKLEIEYDDMVLFDYMNLLKINGEWKIVSKIFSRKSK